MMGKGKWVLLLGVDSSVHCDLYLCGRSVLGGKREVKSKEANHFKRLMHTTSVLTTFTFN